MAEEDKLLSDEEVFGPSGPEDYLGRSRMYKELRNPAVRDRLIAYTNAEVGGQGPEAQQAFMETIFNRSVARNQTLPKTLSGSYFPGVTHSRAGRGVSQDMRDAYDDLIHEALGSNITNYATGNASGSVGFAGGPMTARYGGEKFGIEGPDRGWWDRVGAGGPPSDLADSGEAPRRKSLLSYLNPISSAEAAPQRQPQRLMTDEEVFGKAAPKQDMGDIPTGAPPPLSGGQRLMTDEEVFGTGAAPTPTPEPTPSGPGIMGYGKELLKQIGLGTVESAVSSPLMGAATGTPENRGLQAAIENIQKGQDIDEAVRQAQAAPAAATSAAESPLYQAGLATRAATEQALQPSGVLNSVVQDIARGLGSMAGSVVGSLYGGGPILAARGEALEKAVKEGATPDQQERAAQLSSVAGATDYADLLLGSLGGSGKAMGLIAKVGRRALQGAFIEGGQEGLQQYIQNAIAKGIYKPDQDVWEDVPYNAFIGAVVGGMVGGAIPERREVSEAPPTIPPTSPGTAYAAMRGGGGPTPAPPPALPAPPDQLNLPLSPPGPPNPPPAEAPPSVVTPAPPPSVVSPPPAAAPAPLEGEILPPAAAGAPGTIFSEPPKPLGLEDLMKERVAPGQDIGLSVGESRDAGIAELPMRQDIKATPGVDPMRLAKLLGQKLYGPDTQALVSMKEMFQNSFDAIKDMFTQGQQDGNIAIRTDETARTITMTDDGIGMTPAILGGPFLTIAGTKKLSSRSSGGLGIAKMQFLFGSERLRVTTMRDGKVSELITTGDQITQALSDKKVAPTISVREPTAMDRAMFPRGHGTQVEVTIPRDYVDASTGKTQPIPFPSPYEGEKGYNALSRSPLLENVNVTLNGKQLEMGTKFPADRFTQFANVNFKWGTARIYMAKEEDPYMRYGHNVHILSNGLWQFSEKLSKDPMQPYGENIPRTMYVDVSSKVKPEDSGYPFDLNRQGFVEQTKDDFAKIMRWIQLLHQQENFNASAENFGEMQYLNYDPAARRVANTTPFVLKAPKPPKPTALRGIKAGDKVVVKDGKLIVNGRKIPDLSLQDVEKFKVNTTDLKIPQDKIRHDQVILHDNTEMSPTGGPLSDPSAKISLTQYGVQKYGNKFYEFNFLVGNLFRQLRDIVSDVPGYGNLKSSGVGISFDQEYRGVNIVVPFRSIFVNSFLPQYSDKPMRSAIGVIGTMVHELSHETHRSEKDLAPVLQGLFIELDTHPTFNFNEFKQKMINVYASYWDMFKDLNGVYQNGNVRPHARSFQGVSPEQGGYGGAAGNVGEPSVTKSNGSSLSDWVAVGAQPTVAVAGRNDGSVTTQGTGSDPSFGQDANQRAIDRETGSRGDVPAVQQQSAFDGIRKALNSARCASTCASQPGVAAAAAHADKMNWFYSWWAGLDQQASINPSHTPIVRTREEASLMHIEESQYQNEGIEIARAWIRLGEMGDRLTTFLDDLSNMRYRTPKEVRDKVRRHPTPQEFNALVAKHRLDGRALGVFKQVQDFFNRQLDRVMRNATNEAMKLTDPAAQAAAINQINAQVTQYRSRPYFPHVRFGRHFVTVRDSKNNVEWFSTYERSMFTPAKVHQGRAVKELRNKYPASQGFTIESGILPEQVEQFLGMPSVLLDHVAKSMTLSPKQRDALEQLMFQMSPALSFEHFFEHKKYTPGYSNDFIRAFSRYAFFSSRYIARTKWIPVFRQRIAEANALRGIGNKESQLADYMQRWLDNAILDARGDYGIFKGAIFTWSLGYNVAAATNNLFQMPMIAYPWLSGRYGDVRAAKAMAFQFARLNTFYRRGRYPDPKNMSADFEMRAISWLIKTGRITETQAAELATLMQSDNITNARGLRRAMQWTNWLMEKGSVFFEAAEQINRRVTVRAALELAMGQPNSKAVDSAVAKSPREYDQLVNVQGFTPTEARAIAAAIDAVETTNFVYARWARPPFMRGRVPGTIFVFKRYIQSVVFLMWSGDKRNMLRYLIPMLLLGGLGAVPGYEDVEDILDAILKLSGIDSSLEKLMREFIQDQFGGNVPPDIILHGFARRGFGIPWLLDQMGGMASGTPGRSFLLPGPGVHAGAPILDFSKGISGGPLLPVQVGKLLAAQEGDFDKALGQTATRAAGATFSAGMNVLKALAPNNPLPWDDPHRYEKALPRVLGSITKAYEAFTEERTRGSKGGPASGQTILRYNPRDTEQLMEIIFQGLGYNTLRESQKWDSIIMKREHEAFLAGQQKGIYAQLDEAVKGGDQKEIDKVVGAMMKFNAGLQPEERGYTIKADEAVKSLKARERNRILQEQGLSAQKRNIPLRGNIQGLFPESVIDVQRR